MLHMNQIGYTLSSVTLIQQGDFSIPEANGSKDHTIMGMETACPREGAARDTNPVSRTEVDSLGEVVALVEARVV